MQEPLFQRIHLHPNQSYNILKVDRPHFVVPWHFHPEIEIMYVLEGEGTRFVGDSIKQFGPGDLVMVGANLSHVWKSSSKHYEVNSPIRASAKVILFTEECFGETFFQTPELRCIKELILRSRRGIHFFGKTQALVADKITKAYEEEGIRRFLSFIDILSELAESQEYTLLTQPGYREAMQVGDMQRLNKVLDYLFTHFCQSIRLEAVAAEAHMSPTAFCRYFKSHTNKTLIEFINELRVGHAHKLLMENQRNISQICYESGFNNISNFYQQFQKVTGKSPKEYRNEQLEKLWNEVKH